MSPALRCFLRRRIPVGSPARRSWWAAGFGCKSALKAGQEAGAPRRSNRCRLQPASCRNSSAHHPRCDTSKPNGGGTPMRPLRLLACLLLLVPFVIGQDDEPMVEPRAIAATGARAVRESMARMQTYIGDSVRASVWTSLGTQQDSEKDQPAPSQGQWLMDVVYGGDTAQFALRYRTATDGWWGDGFNNYSRSMPLASVQGLTKEQMFSTGQHVAFKLVRDAGSFDCDGWFANGQGSGQWKFAPSAAFTAELQKRGFTAPTAAQQFELAAGDFQLALLDELKAQKYDPVTTDEIVP